MYKTRNILTSLQRKHVAFFSQNVAVHFLGTASFPLDFSWIMVSYTKGIELQYRLIECINYRAAILKLGNIAHQWTFGGNQNTLYYRLVSTVQIEERSILFLLSSMEGTKRITRKVAPQKRQKRDIKNHSTISGRGSS